MTLISVIVPVYNCEKYLEAGIQAILDQTLKKTEVILVDDGSTDGSGAICDRFAEKDARVKVIHKENGGSGSARNAGMDAAQAQYLVFADADDRMEPNMLERFYQTIAYSGADMMVCGYRLCRSFDHKEEGEVFSPGRGILPNERMVKDFFVKFFPDGMAGYLWNKIYRADIIKDNQIRFTDMKRYQDGMFNLQVIDHVKSAVLSDECLYNYKVSSVEEVFVKNPKNKFDLLLQLVGEYDKTLKKWGMESPETKANLYSFYLRGIASCMDSMFSPDWGFTTKMQRDYLERITNEQLTHEALAHRGHYTDYLDATLDILEKKDFSKIIRRTKFKLFVKKHFRGLFEKLRKAK